MNGERPPKGLCAFAQACCDILHSAVRLWRISNALSRPNPRKTGPVLLRQSRGKPTPKAQAGGKLFKSLVGRGASPGAMIENSGESLRSAAFHHKSSRSMRVLSPAKSEGLFVEWSGERRLRPKSGRRAANSSEKQARAGRLSCQAEETPFLVWTSARRAAAHGLGHVFGNVQREPGGEAASTCATASRRSWRSPRPVWSVGVGAPTWAHGGRGVTYCSVRDKKISIFRLTKRSVVTI